jgi:hypothetical protein
MSSINNFQLEDEDISRQLRTTPNRPSVSNVKNIPTNTRLIEKEKEISGNSSTVSNNHFYKLSMDTDGKGSKPNTSNLEKVNTIKINRNQIDKPIRLTKHEISKKYLSTKKSTKDEPIPECASLTDEFEEQYLAENALRSERLRTETDREKNDPTDRHLINSKDSSMVTNDNKVDINGVPRRRRTKFYHPELKFIKEIIKVESMTPDQVQVNSLFINYKIFEFITAFFAFVSNIIFN